MANSVIWSTMGEVVGGWCPVHGTWAEFPACPECYPPMSRAQISALFAPCRFCYGYGKRQGRECFWCKGRGYMAKGHRG